MKAIALLSGGLDSTLAARLVLQQGIELEGLHFYSIFNRTAAHKGDSIPSKNAARWLGIPHRIIEFSKDQMELVKHPKHGHGKT
jgi:tRNA-specific 2-thiouridylase